MKTQNNNIPKLRFPEFSEKWYLFQLKNVSSIFDGTHQTPNYVVNGIKFVSVEDINDIYATKKFISEDDYIKNYKIKPQKGDILLTRITAGIIGATAILDQNTSLAYYVSLALIRKNENVELNFLNQNLNSENFRKELHKRIIHVAFPKKINLGDIGVCKLHIPSLPEQTKIADFLTSVDEKIQKLNRKKELLEHYKKGVMQKIFNQELRFKDENGDDFPEWEEKQLGEISHIATGSSNRQDSIINGKYTFFDRSVDIRSSNIFLFDSEAVIVAGEGSDFIPKYFKGKFDLHQRTYAIMDFIDSLGLFLFYFIYFHRSYFLSQAVGSTVKSLRQPMFQKMIIYLPILTEQRKIADFLTAIDNKIEKVNRQTDKAKEFKQGLLQQMFV